MPTHKEIQKWIKKNPGKSLTEMPGLKEGKTLKPIVLDKKRVWTKAGERSSEVSEKTARERKRAVKEEEKKSPESFKKQLDKEKSEPIKLEKKDFVEKIKDEWNRPIFEGGTIGEKAKSFITSPKTTLGLSAALVALLTAGSGAAAIEGTALSAVERAVITRTATRYTGGKVATITTQRAFIGRTGTSMADKLFRFSTSKKSLALTKSLLTKTFSTIQDPTFIVTAIGSYPFANFIKEEALQTLSIPIYQALKEGDIEAAKNQIAKIDAMIAEKDNLLDKIPFVNVLTKLKDFFDAAQEANNAWKSIIAKAEENAQIEAEKPTFAEERATADEEAKQRDIEEMEWKANYYALIREGKYEEANELLQSQK